jgi:hypothetical protein
MAVNPPTEKETPAYALPGAFALLSTALVLVIVCMPTRKST